MFGSGGERMILKVEELSQRWRPYLDDGIDDRRGIVDFRLTISDCKCEADFKYLYYKITEAIANTVDMFGTAVNFISERR
jgi:hypothetical protein